MPSTGVLYTLMWYIHKVEGIIVHRLADAPLERFDPKLNRDQIQQCLSKLLRLYSEAEHTATARWAEFESYFLLTNLGRVEGRREQGEGRGKQSKVQRDVPVFL